MWESLEHVGWVVTLGTTGWLYNSVAVIHYLTMFWFIGSIAIVDLRVMGVAAKERNVAELGDQLLPWAWIGFTLSVIAGFLEFATAAGDWAAGPGIPHQAGDDYRVRDFHDFGADEPEEVGAGPANTDGGEGHCVDFVAAVDCDDRYFVRDSGLRRTRLKHLRTALGPEVQSNSKNSRDGKVRSYA